MTSQNSSTDVLTLNDKTKLIYRRLNLDILQFMWTERTLTLTWHCTMHVNMKDSELTLYNSCEQIWLWPWVDIVQRLWTEMAPTLSWHCTIHVNRKDSDFELTLYNACEQKWLWPWVDTTIHVNRKDSDLELTLYNACEQKRLWPWVDIVQFMWTEMTLTLSWHYNSCEQKGLWPWADRQVKDAGTVSWLFRGLDLPGVVHHETEVGVVVYTGADPSVVVHPLLLCHLHHHQLHHIAARVCCMPWADLGSTLYLG